MSEVKLPATIVSYKSGSTIVVPLRYRIQKGYFKGALCLDEVFMCDQRWYALQKLKS